MRWSRLLSETDIVPGVAAVVMLAVGAFWLPLPSPGNALVGLGLAALTYVGLRLLLVRQPQAQAAEARRAALARARAEVDLVRQLGARLPATPARDQVKAITATMDAILAVLAEDQKDAHLTREFTDRYVQPARRLLEEYEPLVRRDVASSRAQRAVVEEQLLPLLAEELGRLYERVHRGDVMDLAIASEVLAVALGHADLPVEPPTAPPATVPPATPPATAALPPATSPAPAVPAIPPQPTVPTQAAPISDAPGLTDREIEVLRLIAMGRSNREIADELSLSVRTVERHITNLYTKINARNRADATGYALRHGHLRPDELPDLVLDVSAARLPERGVRQ